ncbi:MAG: glutamine-synthetase adenylyltransferase, partial [Pseudomonadota bacterium]
MAEFEQLITRVPRAHNAERGQDAVARLSVSGTLAELISGAAGSSPHLADLIRREGDWLADALETAPEDAADALLQAPVTAPLSDLRQKKARMSLLIALADLGGVWPLETVTGTLTRFADHAVHEALRAAVAEQLKRGKIPGQTEDDLDDTCGLSVIAMGKMGAFELNYSSDIDLICLFDETRFAPEDYPDARRAFVRAVRKMCTTLSDRTADGYVFRTDLRLRPDASVTPVAMSMEAAERYYESLGRTWERAAYIKARPCAGDTKAGARFLDALTPFVWRRHLDFAAIQDAHDMRTRIRDHKGLHQPVSHLGHDLKLGKGGIREIEFFTQTGQLIAGGRDPNLRASGTVAALRQLTAKGWVKPDVCDQLVADYSAHRETEHRVQMIADQQTHDLPDTADEFERLAALSGRDARDYATEIEDRLNRVATLTEVFFKPKGIELEETPLPDAVAKWSTYRSMRSPRAQEIFRRVWPQLKARIDEAAFPDEALAHFDEFLKGLPAGVQVFSLFEANPQLLDLVVDVVDTAPGLAQYLASNAEVFDAVIAGHFFSDWPGAATLTEELEAQLAELDDYEKRLDRTRVWAREWHFRVGVHLLRGLINAETAGRQYADVAGAAVAGLWPYVTAQFATKHGPPPGRGAMVLAMGSL